ncbi:MAG TPA: ATP-binding protein [Opitutaceae bacterium]|nr:ATP-binding protein [Opitutaceae bacterium]
MSPFLVILVPVTVLSFGIMVFCANPRRLANQAAFVALIDFTLWITFREISIRSSDGLFWFRLSVFFGSLAPALIWVLKASLETNSWLTVAHKCRWAILAVTPIALLPWTEWFIPSHSTEDNRIYGIGYYVYIVSLITIYSVQCYLAINFRRTTTGTRKLEFQTISLSGSFLGLTVILLMALDKIFPGLVPKQSSLLLVVLFSVWMAASIITHKIFDSQYLFRLAGMYSALAAVTTCFGLLTYISLHDTVPLWMLFGATSVIAIAVNKLLGPRLERVFFDRPGLSAARESAHRIARTALTEEKLKSDLASTIGGWTETIVHVLSVDDSSEATGLHLQLSPQDPVYRALQGLGWATPERLQRERATEERSQVQAYLQAHRLGALIVATAEGTPLVLAVGQRISRRPFTYPEIQHLQEFAALSQLALTKVRLVEQAIHADRLATVGVLGASLAHEIRNPLYAIKAFAELLGDHYDRPEFRNQFRRMVTEELDRIDELLSQLMRMASPRKPVLVQQHLHGIIEQSLELVGHKARSHGIVVQTDFQATDDMIGTDAAYARQVLFNLCLNAIQVLVDRPDPRWIRLATRNIAAGLELTVSDNGPGIPEALRNRLFQRFQSMSARGLGLGLSISREIMLSLGGGLEVDAHRPGHGAVFRLVFPQERAAGTIAPSAHGHGVTDQQKV